MGKKIALILGVVGLAAMASVALAQSDSAVSNQPVTPSTYPMILKIGHKGNVLLRGTVDSISPNSLTVKSWGGNWTVNVSSQTKTLPATAGGISGFKQGDFVGVLGTVDETNSWTVNANLVRDWTERRVINQEAKQNARTVHQEIRAETPRNYLGTASNVNASGQSFTLTSTNGKNYSVTLAAGAKILQRNWLTLDFSGVQNGDHVRVWGMMSSSTISASIFRDLSVPRK